MATKIKGSAGRNEVYPGQTYRFTDLPPGIGAPATLVLGGEPVYLASEVREMLIELRKKLEANCRWQNRVEVISASVMRQAFQGPGILSIDPA